MLEADSRFYESNYGRGITRSAAAVLVKYLNPIMSNKNPRLRGSAKSTAKSSNKNNRMALKPNTQRADVPAAYGFTVRTSTPRVTRTGTGAHIIGSDFAGTVNAFNTSAYEPAASVPMNPSYFNSAMLGNLSRVYEKYRFRKAILEYIPSVATSVQGQLVILSDRSVKNPFLDGASASFLGRALSQSNAVACPLWQRTTFEIETNDQWSLVDPLIDGDLDDTISGEVQLYAFCPITVATGILIMHYEIEFKDPLYTYHPTLVPVPIGIGTTINLFDDTAVNAVTDVIRLGGASLNLGQFGSGSVFRLVFQRTPSITPAGPATWSNVAQVLSMAAATTGTTASTATNITMVAGTTLYGVLISSTLMLYTSYDNAVAGNQSGALFYQTATTAVGSWQFLIAGVRLGTALMITNQ